MTCGVIGARAPRSARVRVVLAVEALVIAAFCCPLSMSAAEAPIASTSSASAPATKIEIFDVADVREGMQGEGRTVLAGTELVDFQATVLGVLRNVKPGQDLVLCRLAGAGLEYTGVVAGMSGSPVYLDGKLLGAVAYTWQFNKEPIAGVTPFAQMRSFAAHRTPPATVAATAAGAAPLALLDVTRDPSTAIEPLRAGAMVAAGAANDALAPVAVPLSATGFGPRTLADLSARLGPMGMVPMAAGAVTSDVLKRHSHQRLEPGSAMAVSLISGDFDLSGMGTTTHVEGDRVWGWGHPFLGTGACDYVLRGGYIHLVNPKSDLSTKIGSPLDALGVVHADVSTCIAGRIGAEPDLVPVNMTMRFADQGETQRYQVRIVRHPQLLGSLIATVLSNLLEGAGAVDQEITVKVDASVRAAGLEPIVVDNVYSGMHLSGTSGAMGLLNQVAVIADGLTRNPFAAARLESIECHAEIQHRRTSAAITWARIESDTYEPGDQVRATVRLRPYKKAPVDVAMRLQLPDDVPPGNYELVVCDASSHLKRLFSEEPRRLAARNVEEIAAAYRLQLSEKRSTLFARVLLPDTGLEVEDVDLPQLPASARAVFSTRRASVTRNIQRAVVTRQPTDWVVEGSTALRFAVVDHKRVTP